MKAEYTSEDPEGPDLSELNPSISSFVHQVFSSTDCILSSSAAAKNLQSSGNIIVNETGSVHLSFACDEGAELFVIWSGRHTNVSPDKMPPPHILPDLPPTGNSYYISLLLI